MKLQRYVNVWHVRKRNERFKGKSSRHATRNALHIDMMGDTSRLVNLNLHQAFFFVLERYRADFSLTMIGDVATICDFRYSDEGYS